MNPYLALRQSPLILAYRQWEAGWKLVEVPSHEAPLPAITVATGLPTEIPPQKDYVPLWLSPDGLACWHPETTGGKLYVRKGGNGVWEYVHFWHPLLSVAKRIALQRLFNLYFDTEA